jgi:hypothetical protein
VQETNRFDVSLGTVPSIEPLEGVTSWQFTEEPKKAARHLWTEVPVSSRAAPSYACGYQAREGGPGWWLGLLRPNRDVFKKSLAPLKFRQLRISQALNRKLDKIVIAWLTQNFRT